MFSSLPAPPPQPPWEGMHPLVVHFPIALLLFAAVFVVLAAIVPRRGWWFSVSALILLIGGTVGAGVAISTGEAARDVVEDGEEEMFDVLQEHEDMAEQVRNVFVVLTAVYAFVVFLPLVAGSLQSWKFSLPANLLFLIALLGANLLLANTAHLGGRLVHQYGVLSELVPEGEAATDTDDEEEADDGGGAVDEEGGSASQAGEEETMDAAEEDETAAPATGEPTSSETSREAPVSPVETEASAAETEMRDAPDATPANEGAAKETPQP